MESLSCATIKAFLLEFRLSVRLKEKSNYTWHFISQKRPPIRRGKKKEHKQKKINNSEKEKNKRKQKQKKKKKSNKNRSIWDIVSKATIHIYSGRETRGLHLHYI